MTPCLQRDQTRVNRRTPDAIPLWILTSLHARFRVPQPTRYREVVLTETRVSTYRPKPTRYRVVVLTSCHLGMSLGLTVQSLLAPGRQESPLKRSVNENSSIRVNKIWTQTSLSIDEEENETERGVFALTESREIGYVESTSQKIGNCRCPVPARANCER